MCLFLGFPFCSRTMFLSSLWSRLLIWVLVSFPSQLASGIFFFTSLCIAFTSSFILCLYSVISVSILITTVLNSASDRLAISISLSSFSRVLICFPFGPYFFVLFLCDFRIEDIWHLLCLLYSRFCFWFDIISTNSSKNLVTWVSLLPFYRGGKWGKVKLKLWSLAKDQSASKGNKFLIPSSS